MQQSGGRYRAVFRYTMDAVDGGLSSSSSSSPPPHGVGLPVSPLNAAVATSGIKTATTGAAPSAAATTSTTAVPTSSSLSSAASPSVTAIGCVNSCNSGLVVLGGGDRSLSVLDLRHGGKALRRFDGAHARAVHTIIVPSPSATLNHSSDAYDTFLTAAPDDCVTMWDLRAARPALRLCGGHRNRRQAVGLALSPCLRYVAAGSEDGACYIYDVRAGGYVRRVRSREVTSGVDFNPAGVGLATASFGGVVSFFK